MTTPDTRCALWYWRHSFVRFSLHESEEGAARSAEDLYEYDEGAPIGVQFPDGRTLRTGDWPAYQEHRSRLIREAVETAHTTPAPRPTRVVTDPFEGQKVTVETDEPEWLGKP